MSDRLRVHINATAAVMGGATRHLPPFVDALASVRPRWALTVWVASGSEVGPFPEGVEVRRVARRGMVHRLWWDTVGFERLVRRDGADVVVNLTNAGPLRSRVPSLLYQRNPLYFDRTWVVSRPWRFRAEAWFRRQLAFMQMRSARVTVVPSRTMADNLRVWRGCPRLAAVEVVPHAVDSSRFHPSTRPWPPPTTRPLRLLSVSHAAPHKDQVMLPALAAGLAGRGVACEVWLTVAPDDDPRYVADIRATADALHVADRLLLLGRVRDVERLYDEADVMVFPSRTESFGFPVAEAMASGLPVVASRIGSTVELLGDNGWYFEPGNPTDAQAAVMGVLGAAEEVVRRRTSAAAAAVEGMTWARNAGSVSSVIERCVARPVRGRPTA